jgi:hypothetical protein
MVLGDRLGDADEDPGRRLDDRPVEPADAVPAVVYSGRVLDGVADEIDEVRGISAVVRLLDEDVDPDLALVPADADAAEPFRQRLAELFRLRSRVDMAATTGPPDGVLGARPVERDGGSRLHFPGQVDEVGPAASAEASACRWRDFPGHDQRACRTSRIDGQR